MRAEIRNPAAPLLARAVELSRVPGAHSRTSGGYSGAPLPSPAGEATTFADDVLSWTFELGFDALGGAQAKLSVEGEMKNYGD